MKGELEAYVDGSYCTETKRASWAVVIVQDDIVLSEQSGVVQDWKDGFVEMQSVAGELSAAVMAFKYAIDNNCKIKIRHDNMGIANWALGKWKTKNKHTKSYADIAKDLVKTGLISFEYVNPVYNKRADSLARVALGKSEYNKNH